MKNLLLLSNILIVISTVVFSTSAFANCDFEKAARNEVLDRKIGISGKCDFQKASKSQATKAIDDTLSVDSRNIRKKVEKKTNIKENKMDQKRKVIKLP